MHFAMRLSPFGRFGRPRGSPLHATAIYMQWGSARLELTSSCVSLSPFGRFGRPQGSPLQAMNFIFYILSFHGDLPLRVGATLAVARRDGTSRTFIDAFRDAIIALLAIRATARVAPTRNCHIHAMGIGTSRIIIIVVCHYRPLGDSGDREGRPYMQLPYTRNGTSPLHAMNFGRQAFLIPHWLRRVCSRSAIRK